jgi:hypothetical protein
VVCGEEKQCCGRSLTRVAKDYQKSYLYFALLLPKSDAEPFQDITDTQQDQLLADLTAAAIAREQVVTGGTHDGEAQAWQHWTTYCKSIGCTDLFMDQLT